MLKVVFRWFEHKERIENSMIAKMIKGGRMGMRERLGYFLVG